MEKQIWILILVGLCCISPLTAQKQDSMSFDGFNPVEEEDIDQRLEQGIPEDYDTIMADREFLDDLEYEDEDIENDVAMRELNDEKYFHMPEEHDGQMEDEMEEKAGKEKTEIDEDSCTALAEGMKDTCETDVESYSGQEKTTDRLILNRKAQTITDLVKEGIKKQIVHFDYKRNILVVALQRRKVCMLYKLPPITKRFGSRFFSAAKKMAAFSKNSGVEKRSILWKKAKYGRTRYGARFQPTGEAVNSTTLGTVISNKVCKGLNMKWVKVVTKPRGQTASKDKKESARESEDLTPNQGSDEELLEKRAYSAWQSACRVVFFKTERRLVQVFKCGWLWLNTCEKYTTVHIYTMRCS